MESSTRLMRSRRDSRTHTCATSLVNLVRRVGLTFALSATRLMESRFSMITSAMRGAQLGHSTNLTSASHAMRDVPLATTIVAQSAPLAKEVSHPIHSLMETHAQMNVPLASMATGRRRSVCRASSLVSHAQDRPPIASLVSPQRQSSSSQLTTSSHRRSTSMRWRMTVLRNARVALWQMSLRDQGSVSHALRTASYARVRQTPVPDVQLANTLTSWTIAA